MRKSIVGLVAVALALAACRLGTAGGLLFHEEVERASLYQAVLDSLVDRYGGALPHLVATCLMGKTEDSPYGNRPLPTQLHALFANSHRFAGDMACDSTRDDSLTRPVLRYEFSTPRIIADSDYVDIDVTQSLAYPVRTDQGTGTGDDMPGWFGMATYHVRRTSRGWIVVHIDYGGIV